MQRLGFAALIGLGGLAVLIYLGVWQVQRLAWKQGLLTEISAEIASDPIPLNTALDDGAPRYTPVATQGVFGDGHIRMLASRKSTGPVFRIIRPFETDDAGRVLIDTGWIKDGSAVPDVPTGLVSLLGNLDNPNEADGFTPDPDLENNMWFARDVPAMAAVLDTQPILVVLREPASPRLGLTPWPVSPDGIPNDHLQYAITWFSLAIIWAGMTFAFVRRVPRTTKEV